MTSVTLTLNINVNHQVEVTLTKAGAATYNRHLIQEAEALSKRSFKREAVLVSEGQTVKTELWHLFSIFGEGMCNGCDIPFKENAIRFQANLMEM